MFTHRESQAGVRIVLHERFSKPEDTAHKEFIRSLRKKWNESRKDSLERPKTPLEILKQRMKERKNKIKENICV